MHVEAAQFSIMGLIGRTELGKAQNISRQFSDQHNIVSKILGNSGPRKLPFDVSRQIRRRETCPEGSPVREDGKSFNFFDIGRFCLSDIYRLKILHEAGYSLRSIVESCLLRDRAASLQSEQERHPGTKAS